MNPPAAARHCGVEKGGVPVARPDVEGLPVFSPDGLLLTAWAGTDITVIDRKGTVMATIEAVPIGEFGAVPSWQPLSE